MKMKENDNIICNKKLTDFENKILQKLENSKFMLCFPKNLNYSLMDTQEEVSESFSGDLSHCGEKGIGGFYRNTEKLILIWQKYRKEAFPHEIGHFIHYNLPTPLREKIETHFNLIKTTPKLFDWDRVNVNEYFADSFKYFIINNYRNMKMKDPVLYGILSSLFNPF